MNQDQWDPFPRAVALLRVSCAGWDVEAALKPHSECARAVWWRAGADGGPATDAGFNLVIAAAPSAGEVGQQVNTWFEANRRILHHLVPAQASATLHMAVEVMASAAPDARMNLDATVLKTLGDAGIELSVEPYAKRTNGKLVNE
jgi:hypothetical protein